MYRYSCRWLSCLIACTLGACSSPTDNARPAAYLADVAALHSVEPNLSASANGAVIMSWLEPDGPAMALRYAVLHGRDWSQPVTVARGDDWFINWADIPSVVAMDDTLWAAHWLRMAEGGIFEYDIAVSVSTDSGRSWQPAITPHTDGTLSEHGFVSLFPDAGGIGALWLDGRETLNEGGTTLRSTVIGHDGALGEERLADGLVCDCCQTDVAIGPEGPVAVYRDRSAGEIRDIYVMRMIDGGWQPGVPVAREGWRIDACPVNGPAIAARGDTVAVAWFTAAGDLPRVRLAFSEDGARTFRTPIDLASDRPLGRVGVVLDTDGTAIVTWLRQADISDGEILARPAFVDGTLGPVTKIASTGAGPLSGFPKVANLGDDLIVAWTATEDGATRVRSLAYGKRALKAGGGPPVE